MRVMPTLRDMADVSQAGHVLNMHHSHACALWLPEELCCKQQPSGSYCVIEHLQAAIEGHNLTLNNYKMSSKGMRTNGGVFIVIHIIGSYGQDQRLLVRDAINGVGVMPHRPLAWALQALTNHSHTCSSTRPIPCTTAAPGK